MTPAIGSAPREVLLVVARRPEREAAGHASDGAGAAVRATDGVWPRRERLGDGDVRCAREGALDLLASWIDESYRAVAPKRLAAAAVRAADAPRRPRPRNARTRSDHHR
jgi:hypothetical protein